METIIKQIAWLSLAILPIFQPALSATHQPQIVPTPGLDQNFVEATACKEIDTSSSVKFARCYLGTLELKLPVGYELRGLSVEVRFDSLLRQPGEQIAAVVRTRFQNRTLSQFEFQRIDAETEHLAEPLIQGLRLQLEIPAIAACGKDRSEPFEFHSTYFVNSQTGAAVPHLKYLHTKVIDYQIHPIHCEN